MLKIGVQSDNVIEDGNPQEGFAVVRRTGFSCVDFSLNRYLRNSNIYKSEINHFFSQSIQELEMHFSSHKLAAEREQIFINQMHMPYPIYMPNGSNELNGYLREVVAPKSLAVCAFFGCPYIVLHGYKTVQYVGSEEKEWDQTERLINFLAPMAKEMGITLCIENLYSNVGGHIVGGSCCNAAKLTERIDRINEKYHAEVLGFCFDTGHANLVGIDFENFMTKLGHRLKVLHIHDNDGKGDLHQIPFTFTLNRENEPSTDWEAFIKGICNIRFDKVLSFETAPVLNAFPEEMKETVLSFIAQIGQYFIKKIEKCKHMIL